jgi:hypothetical protein
VRQTLGSRYWRKRLANWGGDSQVHAGYTLLVPVPGDLPVFLDLALAACRHQSSDHRDSTIVLPDRPSPTIDRIVERYSGDWPDDLSVVLLPLPERWFLPLLKSGSRNHGLQVITGVEAAVSTHIILHDADLIPGEVGLHEAQYASCVERSLCCLGLTGVWDPWYEQKGLALAATWELCARVDWFRSFAPHLHMGHLGEMFGEEHVFDTTLFPQASTEKTKISGGSGDENFVHFNYVISAYRLFQRHGVGYLDDRFRILFIAILVELFSSSEQEALLPSLERMAGELGSGSAVLTHPGPDSGRDSYGEFRQKLEKLFDITWVPPERLDNVKRHLVAFDRWYGFGSAVHD